MNNSRHFFLLFCIAR